MRKEIEERVAKAIQENVFPGCIIGIVRANGEREIAPFGSSIYGTGGERVKADTVYDLASITKSIPTASLALLLIAEGKLTLSDTVKKYLPELENDYDATIEDLLTYRAHGTQLSLLKDKTPDEFIAHFFSHGFDCSRGEKNYTNLPAFLLGLILERVTDESLDALARRHFFEPLGMKNTTFFTKKIPYMEQKPIPYMESVPTEIDEQGNVVCGMPHDESARIFAKVEKAVGHAGLFSTVPDLLNFLEALLQGKYLHIVEGAEKGLGWQLNDANLMGQHTGPRLFGKTGFTGCSVACDIHRGVAFAILSNRTYPKRPPDQEAINAFRRDIVGIIFS